MEINKSIIIEDVKLQEEVYKGCTTLEKVVLLNVKELPDGCFEGCTSLVSIELPLDLESIGSGVFYECSSLKEITIPSTVEEMGLSVFFGCTSLHKIRMSSKLLSSLDINIDHTQVIDYTFSDGIREGIFSLSLDKTTLLYVHDVEAKVIDVDVSLTVISQDAFINCDQLKEIIVSEGTIIEELYFDEERAVKITYRN